MLAVALLLVGVDAGATEATGLGERAQVLFLRVQFPDASSNRELSDFTNEDGDGWIDRLASYWAEVSLGRFGIDPVLSSRLYTLPRRRRAYVNRPTALVEDAIRLASEPEPDGERGLLETLDPDVVFLFFAGPGAESDIKRAHPGLPWSNAVTHPLGRLVPGWTGTRGVLVGDEPLHDLSPFGVMAHEFGHALGLPELYAPGKTHEGIGIWGLMGQGTWVGMGDRPPHPSAWSKLKLGWVDPVVVESTQRLELGPVESSGEVALIYAKGADIPTEYFLVENRRQLGSDRRVPGEGLLVWHVDDELTNFRRSQDNALHKRVSLLTPDVWPSHLDIGHGRGGNRGDAGDVWTTPDAVFGPKTQPSTRAYDGSPGRFTLRNISSAGSTMSFDVIFEEGSDAAVSTSEPASSPSPSSAETATRDAPGA